MSRPWNVAETGSRRSGDCPMSTASTAPPRRSAASIKQAVVRAHEHAALLGGSHRHRPAGVVPHGGIHHGEMDPRRACA